MKTNEDLQALLRDADPLNDEPGLSVDAIAEMRRAVLSAVPDDARRAPAQTRFFAMAAALALVTVASVAILKRSDAVTPRSAVVPEATAGSGERRQMHFSTPGGTRIIWTFDPAFQLKEARQ